MKGRKPVYYRIRAHAAFVVGVDFWARSAAAVIQDFAGNRVSAQTIHFPAPLSAEDALLLITTLISDMFVKASIDPERYLV